jgi:hypothetical protein
MTLTGVWLERNNVIIAAMRMFILGVVLGSGALG